MLCSCQGTAMTPVPTPGLRHNRAQRACGFVSSTGKRSRICIFELQLWFFPPADLVLSLGASPCRCGGAGKGLLVFQQGQAWAAAAAAFDGRQPLVYASSGSESCLLAECLRRHLPPKFQTIVLLVSLDLSRSTIFCSPLWGPPAPSMHDFLAEYQVASRSVR